MFKRVLISLAAVALAAGGSVVYASTAVNTAAPSACVTPTSNITHQKMVNYDECRFNELAALHRPAPTTTVTATVTATATATVTASPSASATPTPSPTPSPTPTATEPPSEGFPDASNTGPTGPLTAYTGPMTITANGTVIDSKTVSGDLLIRATGVVIKNSHIIGSVFSEEFTAYSFTISDSLVDAGDQPGTGVGEVNFVMLRTEVIGGNRSVNCWQSCVVRDSYVHGQFTDETGQFHESGIRMGADNEIVHNTIACDAPEVPPDAGCSAGLTGYGDFAAVEDVLVQDNHFLPSPSGGFCAYGGSSGGKPYSDAANNIRFIGNVFDRGPNGKCGSYGPITAFDINAPGNVWSENRWSTGELVPPEM